MCLFVSNSYWTKEVSIIAYITIWYNMLIWLITFLIIVIIVFCILREVLDVWKTGILDVFGNAQPALLRGFIDTLSLDNILWHVYPKSCIKSQIVTSTRNSAVQNPSCLTKRSLIKSPPFTFTQHLHFINRFQQSYLLVVNHEHDNQQQQ